MTDISHWEWFKAHDVYTWLEPLWSGGKWFLNDDGKIESVKTQVMINSPWVHYGQMVEGKCHKNQLLFENVSMRMPQLFSNGKPFVPIHCQNCYKVVVRPKTIVQLFALDDLENRLDLPSKCGIEVRDSVHALYGGYFYNRGLEEGNNCYQTVRNEVDHDPYMGPEVKVILKRACTEMEHAVGPSDKWEITEEQKVIEKLIDEYLIVEDDFAEQPEPVIWRTKRRWIEWAFAHGDETYKQFTGGQTITPGYITYHGGQ